MAQADLRRVRRASSRVDEAREQLTAAILAAHASGETLRDIARAARLSHQRIHEIVREAERDQRG
jgi:Mor family transcriptional regulator